MWLLHADAKVGLSDAIGMHTRTLLILGLPWCIAYGRLFADLKDHWDFSLASLWDHTYRALECGRGLLTSIYLGLEHRFLSLVETRLEVTYILPFHRRLIYVFDPWYILHLLHRLFISHHLGYGLLILIHRRRGSETLWVQYRGICLPGGSSSLLALPWTVPLCSNAD